jgi:hypothetical protein
VALSRRIFIDQLPKHSIVFGVQQISTGNIAWLMLIHPRAVLPSLSLAGDFQG